jgi:hypothetical protein
MPDDISKAIANAKAALGSARAFTHSVGDTEPSKIAPAAPKAAPAPVAKAPSNTMKEANDVGAGIKSRMENEDAARKTLGSMKKGGVIPKTGNYKMHEGEDVVKADKSNLQEVMDRATAGLGAAADKVKSKLHMRIEPTDDNKFIVDHEHRGGMEDMKTMPKNERHAPGSLKELLAHVEKHYAPQMPEKSDEPDGDEPKD